jgi:ribokinase
MPRPVVLIVGSLHYDIMVEADHLPRPDETAVGTRWYPKFGGKGGNQAVSVGKQGSLSRIVGAVGADSFGPFLRDHLTAAGVDDRFVRTVPDIGSGMSVAIQIANGDYAATIVSGANLTIAAADLTDPEVWQDVGLVVLQNEVPEAANIAAATEARRRGIRTVLNAAPFRPLSAEMTSLVDILVVNAVEAEMMGSDKICCLASASLAATRLADQFESVIVTAGALGLVCMDAFDQRLELPAEKVTVVSSHGAGDAFVGALASALVSGPEQGRHHDLAAACRVASAAAARHVAGLA